ncbi:hypothetical protein ABB30_06355 [Stenotrophomonas ginsengisoli]|uniref:DUF485 domain-containing protein n=1 Tax=Stenotrophomonas ginsengisoli TaxID=336566 RepID=A0A0R0D6P8_9GAMM|nr:DUF485 domain-containing protein [Stenotrophomonas ginsengisoli]KRG77871.1 hypothetical protein ABB30_06355 [Stenotrophomonas ginsengisoli]
MSNPTASSPEAIAANPLYQQLRQRRNRLAAVLTVVMLVSYFGFIGLVAFNKELLASPLVDGHVTTIGFAVALALMVLSMATTAWYVRVANTKFDAMTRQIVGDGK